MVARCGVGWGSSSFTSSAEEVSAVSRSPDGLRDNLSGTLLTSPENECATCRCGPPLCGRGSTYGTHACSRNESSISVVDHACSRVSLRPDLGRTPRGRRRGPPRRCLHICQPHSG